MIHVTLHIQPLHARRTIKSCEVKLQLYDVVVYDDSLKGRHCHAGTIDCCSSMKNP